LWLTHTFAVILSGAAIVAAGAGFMAILGRLLGKLEGRNPLSVAELDAVGLAIHLGVGLVLVVVLLQSPKPSLQKIPATKGFVFFAVSSLLGVWGLVILLGALPLPWTLLPMGVAVAVGLRTVSSLPAALTIVPLEAGPEEVLIERGQEDERGPQHTDGIAFSWFLHRTVWRSLFGSWMQWCWLCFPLFFFFGLLLSGWTWFDDPDIRISRFTNLLITSYILLALYGIPLRHLYRLDPLPISRKFLFAWTVIPSLLVLSFGYGAGNLAIASEQPSEQVEYREEESHYYTYVPIGACEIAWDGRPPENTSPWGESHAAWKVPLYAGSRVALYSPYHTPIGSSPEFVALQISRAIEAVHGIRVPPADVQNRYLEVDGEGEVRLRTTGLTLWEDYPDLKPRGHGPEFPVVLLLAGLPFLIMVAVYLRAFRTGFSKTFRVGVAVTLLVFVLALHVSQFVAYVANVTEPWLVGGFLEILIRQLANTLPGGAMTVWGVSMLLLFAGYRLAETQFVRAELPIERGWPFPMLEAWMSD
jgi:hypothetical protein